MRLNNRFVAAIAFAASLFAGSVGAQASNVVAQWIQLAPGSSSANPTTANFGDAPFSLTPTILARAVISDESEGCPVVKIDHTIPLQMSQRFVGSTLTSVPGTAGATNGKAGYPQYFINPAAVAGTSWPGINGGPVATTHWTECEAIVPPGHTTATIDGVLMKLPVAHPKRILVMADTGCRLNGGLNAAGSNQQDCQNASAFPLQYLATLEAAEHPDLIIQVGDWFYRDTNCLTNGAETFTGCNTTGNADYETWGDTFDSWNADVFFPAKQLLARAPWIMLRGNHESCGRGARGWYALLDPWPYDFNKVSCAKTAAYPAPGGTATAPTPTYNFDFEHTYIIPVNNVDILVHDSSFANDSAVDTNMAKNYEVDLTNALAAAGPNAIAIFATHKPTFGLGTGLASGTNPVTDNFGDFTEQATFFSGGSYPGSAFTKGVPANIALFLSGHVHQFQYVNFADPATFAPTLIVGTGGSLLDTDVSTGVVPSGSTDVPYFHQQTGQNTNGKPVDYQYAISQYGGASITAAIKRAYSHDEFGYATLDAVNDANGNTTGYSLIMHKISTNRGGRCALVLGNAPGTTRNITCTF
jgi:hypothetical protein